MIKVLTVLGTRPEAIKCLPVLRALGAAQGVESVVCDTGQHRDMTKPMFALWGMEPDYRLELMQTGQSLCGLMGRALAQLEPVLAEVKPDRVLVQGDTLTAYCAAMAAFLMKIPVGHIEAGLRSHDLSAPWPEEFNRRAIGITTDMHFAPTEQSKADLLTENYPAAQIHVTGNTVIDALLMFRAKMHDDAALKSELAARFTMLNDAKRLVLVTSHRRENFDGGIESICAALKSLASRDDIELIFPVHPNPSVIGPVKAALGDAKNIHLIEPQDYLGFLYLMDRAHLILSDSGGVQEEAPSLQKPLLVLRDTTERPEGIKAGVAKLVGTDTQRITQEATQLLDDPAAYAAMQGGQSLYGDGKAAQRIVDLIIKQHGA